MDNDNIKIEVGTGITYGVGPDRYAGTIHKVSEDGKTFWFTNDLSKNKAVWPEQDWELTPMPETDTNRMAMVTQIKRGKKKGSWSIGGRANGQIIHVGYRHRYQIPCY